MKSGDIIRHCKFGYEGVIICVKENIAEVLLTHPGMYNPEYYPLEEIELVYESRRSSDAQKQ